MTASPEEQQWGAVGAKKWVDSSGRGEGFWGCIERQVVFWLGSR